jgi:uncharacterized membrane protein YhiD involved in acid resistance
LFLTIAIGLGCGAGLTVLTVVAFLGFTLVIWFNNRFQKESENQNLYLTISGSVSEAINIKSIVEELKKHCSGLKLKRSDENSTVFEASFFVEFDDFEKLEEAKAAIKKINPSLSITFMDNARDF